MTLVRPDWKASNLKQETCKSYFSEGALFSILESAVFERLLGPELVAIGEKQPEGSKDWCVTHKEHSPKISNAMFNEFSIKSAAVTRDEFATFKGLSINRDLVVSDCETELYSFPAGTLIDPKDPLSFPFLAKAIYLHLYDIFTYQRAFVSELPELLLPDWRLKWDALSEEENLAKVLVPPFHLFKPNQPLALSRVDGGDFLKTHFFEEPGFLAEITEDKEHILVVLFKEDVVRTKKSFDLELPKVSNYLTQRQRLFTALAHARVENFFMRVEHP